MKRESGKGDWRNRVRHTLCMLTAAYAEGVSVRENIVHGVAIWTVTTKGRISEPMPPTVNPFAVRPCYIDTERKIITNPRALPPGSLHLGLDCVEAVSCRHEQCPTIWSSEAEIGAGLGQFHPGNKLAFSGKDLCAITGA